MGYLVFRAMTSDPIAIDWPGIFLLMLICAAGAFLVKSALDNIFAAIIAYPILMIVSTMIYGALIAFGALTPDDWIKGAMVAGGCGNAVGLIVIIWIMHGIDDASTSLQTSGKIKKIDVSRPGKARIGNRIDRISGR